MFILKRKYDLLNKEYLRLNNKYEELKNSKEELEIIKSDMRFEISKLNQEIDLYIKTIEDKEFIIKKLKDKNNKLDKANKAVTSLWNDINRKLWCNKESVRQLRKLSKDMIHDHKLNKGYIANYIYEISMYIATGIDVELKAKEEN